MIFMKIIGTTIAGLLLTLSVSTVGLAYGEVYSLPKAKENGEAIVLVGDVAYTLEALIVSDNRKVQANIDKATQNGYDICYSIFGVTDGYVELFSGNPIGTGYDFKFSEYTLIDYIEDDIWAITSHIIPSQIKIDGGDLSSIRVPNSVVDIGFGDREYWAFTNEHSQLVRVIADEIILQDEDTEPVLSNGRYYYDEAKVEGTELPDYDAGHCIADSLGGVANAYNITPQNSTLNRHGDQAYMEKIIRDAGGATDFEAIITYPNTTTQIPSHYSYTYALKGNIIHDDFDNVEPSELIKDPLIMQTGISITNVSLDSEIVCIKNISKQEVDITGWKLVSVVGNQIFTFPEYVLEAGQEITIASGNAIGDFKWTGAYIWNNDGDEAELYNRENNLVSEF